MADMFSECYTQGDSKGDIGLNGPGKLSDVITHPSSMVNSVNEHDIMEL